MKPGDIIDAHVADVKDNGIYLTAEGLTGFVNVTNVSWERAGVDPRSHASQGQTLRVEVYAVTETGFYASLKALDPRGDPYQDEIIGVGKRLRARVEKVVSFGAFVRLENGAVGRVAPSEGATGLVVGEELEVEVLSVDAAAGKIELRRTA